MPFFRGGEGRFPSILRAVFELSDIGWSHVSCFLGLTVLGAVFESLGVAMVYPVLEYVENKGDMAALLSSSGYWKYLLQFMRMFSIPVSLLSLMGMVISLILLRGVFVYARRVYTVWMVHKLHADIRSRGFGWLISASMSFFDEHGTGKLMNPITLDGFRASNAIFMLFGLIGTGLVSLFYLMFLATLSPVVTLAAIVAVAGVLVTAQLRFRLSERYGKEISEHNELLSQRLVEKFGAFKLIKLSVSEDREVGEVHKVVERLRSLEFKLSEVLVRMEALLEPAVITAGLSILYLGVAVFYMSLAKIAIFVFILLRLLPLVREVMKGHHNLLGWSQSLIRTHSILGEAKTSDVIKGGSKSFTGPSSEISFLDLTYTYQNGSRPALSGVTLSIPAGKMTALVGPSGAGKSTLVDLNPRLREPQQGCILIDNIPIEDFRLADLRRSIAFVPQEAFLFDDTVANNIRYGRPEANSDEVEVAASQAYADVFIRPLPEGYDTRIGERGVRLSGGERQRIVLARALLQRAPIIVLDEPTSSLDSESERYIQLALEGIRSAKETTLIVIAHRLSTTRTANQIVILDQGNLVGVGCHEELVEKVSWYAKVVNAQGIGLGELAQ